MSGFYDQSFCSVVLGALLFWNHLAEEERSGCFNCGCLCCVSLSANDMGSCLQSVHTCLKNFQY